MTKYDGKCLYGAGPGSPGDCTEERWIHPEKGSLCLCREHAIPVLEGREKAPPLRMTFDYQSVGRKTFLVEYLPDGLPHYDTEPTELSSGEKDRLWDRLLQMLRDRVGR